MASTEISKTPNNLRLFQTFSDFLKGVWKDDKERDWNVYFQEQQFSYFWDNRDVVDRRS